MISRKFSFAAVAVIAAALFSGAANASVVLPGAPVHNGDIIGGWKIAYPEGTSLKLVADGDRGVVVQLQKFATFQSNEGLVITFVQASPTPAQTVSIVDESVTNLSGTNWGSFEFLLVNTTGNSSFASAFDDSAIGPFTHKTVTSDAVVLDGGSLDDGNVGSWGFGPTGGDLVINSPTSPTFKSVFSLKEIPGTPLVPLPAAAWTGLSGLVGLAVAGSAKKLRKVLA